MGRGTAGRDSVHAAHAVAAGDEHEHGDARRIVDRHRRDALWFRVHDPDHAVALLRRRPRQSGRERGRDGARDGRHGPHQRPEPRLPDAADHRRTRHDHHLGQRRSRAAHRHGR